MRFKPPYHACGCRSIGECIHSNGPTINEDKAALADLATSFSVAMVTKLHRKADEGYGGWADEEWTVDDIKAALLAHVDKGDPVDIANFCAFWWNRLGKAGQP